MKYHRLVLMSAVCLSTCCLLAQWSIAQQAATEQPRPEDVLRQMTDYLAKLPAVACKINFAIHVQMRGTDNQMNSTMTARLERPNRIAFMMEGGPSGLTLVSNGQHVWTYLQALNRYTEQDAPKDLSELAEGEGGKGLGMLGASGALIPTNGEDFYKKLTTGVKSMEYVGQENVGEVPCHHLRFTRDDISWDMWVEDGEQPLVRKVVPDFSQQMAKGGGPFKDAKMDYSAEFTDWNVAPQFTEADFAFDPPAGAEKVDSLFEGIRGGREEGPHPLLGKAAPTFETVDPDGHAIDLNRYVGKNIILLDFWATWCGPCVMAMPQVEGVAKKYADQGLVFYAVNAGEEAETVKQFLTDNKREAPVAMDQDGKINGLYRVSGIPQTVLIGKDGKVQVVHIGYSDALGKELSKNIDDLLAGKDLAGPVLEAAKKREKNSTTTVHVIDQKKTDSADQKAEPK